MDTRRNITGASIRFIFLYLVLSLVGAVLLFLSLPSGSGTGFFQCFFTSVSACTLTGLDVAGFPAGFSVYGQWIVLLLMQAGAFITVAASIYFVRQYRGGNEDPSVHFRRAIRSTLVYLALLELLSIAAVFAFMRVGFSIGEKLYWSVFTGISAVCHGGFLPFNDSLHHPIFQESYLLHLTLGGIIIIGSLGYFVLEDIFNIKKMRARMRQPEMGWTAHTRLVVNATAIMMVIGALLYYVLEFGAVLQREKLVEAGITSFFNTVGARTAGFYSIPTPALSTPMLFVFMALMLLGTGFGASGGGLRLISFQALLTRRARRRASRLLAYTVAFILAGWLLLMVLVNGQDDKSLLFLLISAFTHTGLYTLYPAQLPIIGQIILILAMLGSQLLIPSLALIFTRLEKKG